MLSAEIFIFYRTDCQLWFLFPVWLHFREGPTSYQDAWIMQEFSEKYFAQF